jgi:hypothetical protein
MTFHRSKNTMFWRSDALVKSMSRNQRWVDFHRTCGRCGLFFDDIDPIDDDPKKDVTDRMRRRGYQAVAFRVSQDRGGYYCQVFVSRGTGAGPIEAVRDAYDRAVAAGDPVQRGLTEIFDGADYPQPVSAAAVDVMELIG